MRRLTLLGETRLDVDNRISYRLTRLARRLQRNVSAMLRAEHRIPLMGWQVLSVVGRLGPVSAKTITARTELPADQVSRVLDELVKRGWLARQRDPNDRRWLALSLLPRGRQVYDRIEVAIRSMNYEVLRPFTAAERRALDRLLIKLERRSSALLDPPGAWKRYRAGPKKT